MGNILATRAARARHGAVLRREPFAFAALVVLLGTVLCVAGCHSIPPLDTKPLDTAGMSYDTIKQLTSLNITAPEVAQLAAANGTWPASSS